MTKRKFLLIFRCPWRVPWITFLRCLLVVTMAAVVNVSTTTTSSFVADATTSYDDVTTGVSYDLVISHPALNASEGYVPGAVYKVTVFEPTFNVAVTKGCLVVFVDNGGTADDTYNVTSCASRNTAVPGTGTSCAATVDEPCVLAYDEMTSSKNLSALWAAPNSTSCYVFRFLVQGVHSLLHETQEPFCPHSIGCMEYITSTSGILVSPDFPSRYPRDVSCVFAIESASNNRIHLQFEVFELEPPDDQDDTCFDYVTVSCDPPSPPRELMCGSFSANSLRNLSFVSDGNFMIVKFRSDDRRTRAGFRALYYALPEQAYNTISTESTGIVSSLNYPDQYFPNLLRTTTIIVDEMYHVLLNITALDLEYPINGVCLDYVIIETSRDNDDVIKLCGSSADYPESALRFISSRNWLRLTFSSNFIVQKKGFFGVYSAVKECVNQTRTGPSGTLTSINYPESYFNDERCYMTLDSGGSEYVVQLQFLLLDTEASYPTFLDGDACDRDYVDVITDQRSSRFCGSWSGQEYRLRFTSTNSTMTLGFVSNAQVQGTGYEALWKVIPRNLSVLPCPPGWTGYEDSCFRLYEQLLSWPDARTSCADAGAYLAGIEDSGTSHFIEELIKSVMFGGVDSAAVWIGASDRLHEAGFMWDFGNPVTYTDWFPGWPEAGFFHAQPSDDGLSNQDCVELRATFQTPSKGMTHTGRAFWNDRECEVENSFICQKPKEGVLAPLRPSSPLCDAVHVATRETPSGTVVSPGYTRVYPDLVSCDVIIEAPDGYVIEVTFEDFHIEDHPSCAYDRLSLTSPGTDFEGVVRCGDWSDKLKLLRYVTRGNVLSLSFSSDQTNSFSGFLARYSILPESYWCSGDDWFYHLGDCYRLSLEPLSQNEAAQACLDLGGHLARAVSPDVMRVLLEQSHEPIDSGTTLSYWVGAENLGLGWEWLNGTAVDPGYRDGPWLPPNDTSHAQCLLLTVIFNSSTGGLQEIWQPAECDTRRDFVCMQAGNHPQFSQTYYPSGAFGNIQYPSHGGSLYPNSVDLHWIVHGGPSARVAFYIISLDVEWQRDCRYDYLQMRQLNGDGDGDATSAAASPRYCGTDQTWRSYAMPSNQASVIFHSDYSLTAAGFQLNWETVYPESCCSVAYDGNNQSAGNVASVNFPTGYINDLRCVVTIDVRPGHRVAVQFYTLILNSMEPLCSDYLEIGLNGSGTEYSRVLCANVRVQEGRPLILASLFSSVYIYFHTSAGYNQKGYNLTYVAVPPSNTSVSSSTQEYMYNTTLELLALEVGNLTSLNYPLSYPGNVAMSTTLRVPLGYQINLTILHLNFGETAPCQGSYTYIQLVDHYATDQSVIGSHCDDESVGVTVMSYMNSLVLNFVSGETSQYGDDLGYVIQYSVFEDPEFINKTLFVLTAILDHCDNMTCQNDGACAAHGLHADGYACHCEGIYTGLFCNWRLCDSSPCLNAAPCTNLDQDYYCACPQEYAGKNCDVNLTACAEVTCHGHGACIATASGQVTCECEPDWTGAACDSLMGSSGQGSVITGGLVDEPFWIGIIVVCGVLAITGVVFFVRKRCPHIWEMSCCGDHEKDDPGGKTDHVTAGLGGAGGIFEYNYSNPSYTRDSSPHLSATPRSNSIDTIAIPTIKVYTEDETLSSHCNGHVDSIHLDGTGYQSHDALPEGEALFPSDTLATSGVRRAHTATGRLCRQYSQEIEDFSVAGRSASLDNLAAAGGHVGANITDTESDTSNTPIPGPETYHNAVSLHDGTSLTVVDRSYAPAMETAEDGALVLSGSEHRRVNSAQRRKDYAISVRQARHSSSNLETDDKPPSHSSSASHCHSCGSWTSFMSMDMGLGREGREGRLLRRPSGHETNFSRSFDYGDFAGLPDHFRSVGSNHSDELMGHRGSSLHRSNSRHSDTSACSRHHRHRHHRHPRRHRHHRHRHRRRESRSCCSSHHDDSLDVPDEGHQGQSFLTSSRPSSACDPDPQEYYSPHSSSPRSCLSHRSSLSRSRPCCRHHRRNSCSGTNHNNYQDLEDEGMASNTHRKLTKTNSDGKVQQWRQQFSNPGHNQACPRRQRGLSRSMDLRTINVGSRSPIEVACHIPILVDSDIDEPPLKRRLYTSLDKDPESRLSNDLREQGRTGSYESREEWLAAYHRSHGNPQVCADIEFTKRTPSGNWDKVTLDDDNYTGSAGSPQSGIHMTSAEDELDCDGHAHYATSSPEEPHHHRNPGHHPGHLVLQRTHSQPLSENPMWDSAYQSTEQSMEQYSSRPGSNTVSPTLTSRPVDFVLFKPMPNKGEDKRVTNQLELAARKLSAIMDADEWERADEPAPVDHLGPPCSQGVFLDHDASFVKASSKQRRQWPSRMLSMIADEENENSDCASGGTNNTSFELHELRRASSPAREASSRDVTSGRLDVRPRIREREEEDEEEEEEEDRVVGGMVTETIYLPHIGILRVGAATEV